jgi:hypothetical protein
MNIKTFFYILFTKSYLCGGVDKKAMVSASIVRGDLKV